MFISSMIAMALFGYVGITALLAAALIIGVNAMREQAKIKKIIEDQDSYNSPE